MTKPYIEVTKLRDINNRAVFSACLHIKGDLAEFLTYDSTHNMQVAFDNENQFLERVREFGRALNVEVEENF